MTAIDERPADTEPEHPGTDWGCPTWEQPGWHDEYDDRLDGDRSILVHRVDIFAEADLYAVRGWAPGPHDSLPHRGGYAIALEQRVHAEQPPSSSRAGWPEVATVELTVYSVEGNGAGVATDSATLRMVPGEVRQFCAELLAAADKISGLA